ncbi:PREDICTED: signal-induced proliferation-associated 1-like protein 2 isoform X2 [Nicrophorus vespilloides]|uniref:Signal-induced proliferation-associated 1-like protein 2 isoform X2 n=1 Tax=Nicrophorus vespilloides TaxID=110193 RepID=A0ABM1MGR2_NICVS|nr:PREDICTED: signal-induced proliferation-associated 1-like protein 2 isoform X2 [Nicrophorus vespilloides]
MLVYQNKQCVSSPKFFQRVFRRSHSIRDGMIGLQECGPAPPRAPASRVRERAAQAVEYYNTQLQKARVNAGLAAPRSSYNDRHQHTSTSTSSPSSSSRRQRLVPDVLYRSNSSLELLDNQGRCSNPSSPTLKREYGSHGSIDVIERPSHGESFFAMLQDYKPTVLGAICTDQRSPGPSEYLRGIVETSSSGGGCLASADDPNHTPQSPKVRVKMPRFWGSGSLNSTSMKNQRQTVDDSVVNATTSSPVVSAEAEEIARRRAFAHYDCQSLTTNLGYAVRLRRNLLAKRRNTTTGASAASMLTRMPTQESGDEDYGDGHSNGLVKSCPYFRNEIGGEEERVVSLTRLQSNSSRPPLHRPFLAYGVAVLEFSPGETHWRQSTCPYQRLPRPIESVDQGALYYRRYFKDQEHQNWFGTDEQLGPVAISIRREKASQPENQTHSMLPVYQYRIVIRTSELMTLRGAILEDAIPNIKVSSSNKSNMNTKEVLEYVAPEIQLNCLKLGEQNTQDELLRLDEQGLTSLYKVGVMYCKAGQSSEEEMYNNEEAGPAFTEFLETIGKKVELEGFTKYKAGLDNKSNSTGKYSVYSEYQNCEIMFHVSTMLPFTKNNNQQLLRKRHIGNDIVTIVFQEPGALPFTPKGIRSQFQHVFIVVQAIHPCTENTHYKVAVSRSKHVQVFGPPIKQGAVYPKGKAFAEFLLAKVVNAENAAHRSEKFETMATRTRHEYLKDLVTNRSTNSVVDSGQKFSIFSKKKEKIRPRFLPDASQRGAILWQVLLDDSGQSQQIECFLGISADTLVLIEEQSRQIVFVSPCKSILGWSPQTNSLRIYHHQGECLIIHIKDNNCERDELMEIVERLKAVTQGVKVEELSLKRNIMKQLGFHVQPDGIVTLVESSGPASEQGLKQNSRLVEICKVAVSTLTYDQMVDLLKTSDIVTLTVIPPLPEGQPRKGCTLQHCKYNEGNYEGDYENMDESKTRKAPPVPQVVAGNYKKLYEDRSFSPPRSSNSSGYGTGSSSKSFHGTDSRFPANNEGTLTSSSSGHSNDDQWYSDMIQENLDHEPSKPHKSSHSNNTYPCTPKRNHIPMSQSHNHFSQSMQHGKIQLSHSLPLQHQNYNQPLSTVHQQNMNDYSLKLDKNNINKQQNDARFRQESEYTVTRAPKVEYTTLTQLNGNDGHSTDSSISDRLYGIGSEEELSNGSGNISPRTKRANKHLSSIASSRNQSPRSINGEAKLRPGVTARSSNRNSASLSNTLRDDLIRLINPDNIEAAEAKETKSRSRENINSMSLSVHKTQPEVILTLARPATVISNASTTSSPLPVEFKSNSVDRLSPRVTSPSKGKVEALPLPESDCWSSLVDAANRATENRSLDENERSRHWEEDPPDASLTSNTSEPELRNHVSELESRVTRETRRRLSLEEEVRRLKDENRKLQDQAHAAIQQLRKFTEWFFKNVQSQ